MFFKKKIRRAFKNATPNVLGQVMQELPRNKRDRRATADAHAMQTVEKARTKKDRFQEFVATAAALALLIGACGTAVWYALGNTNGTHGSSLATEPTEAPRVAIEKDDIYARWIEAAKTCVEPEDLDNVTPTDDYFRTTWNGEDAYVVRVTYKGYLYELTFSDSGLVKLTVPQTDSIKEDEYITESAAINIAYTQVEDSLPGTNFAWFLDSLPLELDETLTARYYVTLLRHPLGDYSNYEYKTFTICAYTGQIVDVQEFSTADHDDIVDALSIQKTLWNLISDNNSIIPMYQWLDHTSSSSFIIEGKLFYHITFTYEGFEYLFETNHTGKILSITVSVTEDHKPNQVISRNMALELLCLDMGIEIDPGQSVQILYESDGYHITFENHPVYAGNTYIVNATTGQIVEYSSIPLTDIRDIALTHFALPLESSWEFHVEPTNEDMVAVTLFYGGVYTAVIRASDGEVVDDYILTTELPIYMESEVPVSWQTARDIALENCDLSLEELTSLLIHFDGEQNLYNFYFGVYPDEYACCVDAITGQIPDPVVEYQFISKEEAWAVMLTQVSRETQEAFLADILKSDATFYADGDKAYYELWIMDKSAYVARVDAVTGELIDFYTIADESEPDSNAGE